MWPSVLGVVLYALVKKEKLAGLVNAMCFSTGIAPVISEMLLRYPNTEAIAFNPLGAVLALAVGLILGAVNFETILPVVASFIAFTAAIAAIIIALIIYWFICKNN